MTEETWLGHENWVTGSAILQPALEAVSGESDLAVQAQAMQDNLPAELATAAEKDATTRPKAHGLELFVGGAGVATSVLAAFGMWLLYKGHQEANEDEEDED